MKTKRNLVLNRKIEWTKEYCGVSHARNLKQDWLQITLCEITPKEYEVYCLIKHSSSPFTPVYAHNGTKKQCMDRAEEWADGMGGKKV